MHNTTIRWYAVLFQHKYLKTELESITVAKTVKTAQKQIREPMNKSTIKQWAVFLRMLRVHLPALPWTFAFDSNMKGNVCSLSSPHIFPCLIFVNLNFSKLPTATRQRHFPHDKKATGRWSNIKTQRALIYTFCCTTWLMVFEWAQCFISVPVIRGNE